jgi:hypothetical protein
MSYNLGLEQHARFGLVMMSTKKIADHEQIGRVEIRRYGCHTFV